MHKQQQKDVLVVMSSSHTVSISAVSDNSTAFSMQVYFLP